MIALPPEANAGPFSCTIVFLCLYLFLFVSLLHPRGRTRGRAAVDEEDSMDGTEIKESIGPQDTGETLQSRFLYPLCTRNVRSDMEDFLLIKSTSCRGVCLKRVSVKVEGSLLS